MIGDSKDLFWAYNEKGMLIEALVHKEHSSSSDSDLIPRLQWH
jgi:hypothetical protein